MHNRLRYILLFVAAIALQLFLFDTMNLGMYVYPLAYVAFIVLLPMNAHPMTVLVSGLLAGAAMDFFAGTGGVHTIATLFTSYIRRFALNLTVGKETAAEGGMPAPGTLGRPKFARYASTMVAFQCLVFFTFEAMNWRYFGVTLVKMAFSACVTLLFVWLIALLFTPGRIKRTDRI